MLVSYCKLSLIHLHPEDTLIKIMCLGGSHVKVPVVMVIVVVKYDLLGGGFKYVLFSPLFGEDSHFDQYFSDGLKPPTSLG